MTLPVQTWRVGASLAFTPAGTYATVAEVLTAINAMLVAESGASWGVSAYSAANGTLEIKRKGTQTGTLASYRGLIFGGAIPHASALGTGVTPSSVFFYAGCADNASTTGPAQAYTVGSPYPSHRWAGGSVAGYPSSNIQAHFLPHVFMIDSDEMCAIFVNDNARSFVMVFGALAEKLSDNSRVWACSASGVSVVAVGGAALNQSSTTIGRTAVNPDANAIITYHDGTNLKYAFDPILSFVGSATDPLFKSPKGMLVPIYLSEKTQTAAAATSGALGVLRQLRYGPNCINKIAVYNASSVLQCYGTSSGYNISRFALYFDTEA